MSANRPSDFGGCLGVIAFIGIVLGGCLGAIYGLVFIIARAIRAGWGG